MTRWVPTSACRLGAIVLGLAGFVSPVVAAPRPTSSALAGEFHAAAEPVPLPQSTGVDKPTPAELRTRAADAEKAGDWEAAFTAYCQLHVADRSTPDTRARLNATLRRVQQVRRHRDPAFLRFVATLPTADAVNLFAEVAAKVPGLFPDPARATPQQLWLNGIVELERALADDGFRAAYLNPQPADKLRAFRSALLNDWAKRPVHDAREARAALKQLVAAALDAIAVRVPAALAVEVVCGACSGLDEYTVFLNPGATDPAAVETDLSAHGLYLGFHDGGLFVEGVTPGSWAAFGTILRKGDRIAKVNGRPMDMTGPAALADALRMPVGGFHELELVVPNPGAFGLVRLPTDLPTVYGDQFADAVDGIGYVRIGEFQPTTPRELTDAIARLRGTNMGLRALVLDLRGNRGGSFLAGVEVARRLLPGGLIVTTQGQAGEVAGRTYSSDTGMAALEVPLVVLIDADTASAAEVVAAALRDNNRAVLVGMPSFGKGTIQYPLKLAAADDANPAGKPRKSGTVRLTIARLIAPAGTPINGVGVTPRFIEADPSRQLELAVERAIDLLGPPLPPE